MSDFQAPLTDAHAHVFEPGLHVSSTARYVPHYSATVEGYLDALSTAGFERGVLVQPSFLGSDNSYLLAALTRAPNRLRGVIVIDIDHIEKDLAKERVADLTRQGVRGVRLNLIGRHTPDITAPQWKRAGEAMAKNGWHLEIQAAGDQWVSLDRGIRTWPGKVVIDHLGLPRLDHEASRQSVLKAASLNHVWVKVSAPYRSPRDQAALFVADLVARSLTDRLVFGSDWPHTQHENETFAGNLKWAATVLESELLEQSLSTNAEKLFEWDPKSPGNLP